MTDEIYAALHTMRALMATRAKDAARYRDDLMPGAPSRYNDFEAREKTAELTLWLVSLAGERAQCERALSEILGE